MTTEAEQESRPRTPLTRDRVLRAAAALADRLGIEAVTMRGLAEEFGVEAMSLYHHVHNKEDVLNGVVEVVMGEINEAVREIAPPTEPAEWKAVLRTRILAAREVFLRHPWAPAVFQTRTDTPLSVLDYYDSVLALMKTGGFTYQQSHHALHALGSRALGFNQELFTPPNADAAPDPAAFQLMADRLPHLAAMLLDAVHDDPDSTLGWCDDQTEFEFGLDLLLDGLERLIAA
ncbi:MAG: TetR family transcriptional regulator [Catenulispora sp.]|nr:TetR family transcriptional regulator [Catenulispora sp.]